MSNIKFLTVKNKKTGYVARTDEALAEVLAEQGEWVIVPKKVFKRAKKREKAALRKQRMLTKTKKQVFPLEVGDTKYAVIAHYQTADGVIVGQRIRIN